MAAKYPGGPDQLSQTHLTADQVPVPLLLDYSSYFTHPGLYGLGLEKWKSFN